MARAKRIYILIIKVKRNIYRTTKADATNRNPTSLTTVTIPYIKGTSETISRILQPYNIRVAHKTYNLVTTITDQRERQRRKCKFDLDQSELKSSQVNASARKAWPNEVASRPKFSTCVYLRLRLARALEYVYLPDG